MPEIVSKLLRAAVVAVLFDWKLSRRPSRIEVCLIRTLIEYGKRMAPLGGGPAAKRRLTASLRWRLAGPEPGCRTGSRRRAAYRTRKTKVRRAAKRYVSQRFVGSRVGFVTVCVHRHLGFLDNLARWLDGLLRNKEKIEYFIIDHTLYIRQNCCHRTDSTF